MVMRSLRFFYLPAIAFVTHVFTTLVFQGEALALTYGAYRTVAQGSARAISLGGAFAAEENDASCIWIVPAMLPLTVREVDLVFTQAQDFSRQPTPQNSSETVYISSATTLSLAYAVGSSFSLAIGYGTPYSNGPGNSVFSNSSLGYSDFRFSPGYKLDNGLAFAPLISVKTVKQNYSGFTDAFGVTTGLEQIASGMSLGLSAAWQTSKPVIMSLSWEQPQTYNMGNPTYLNARGNGIQPVKIPSLTRYGLSVKIPSVRMMIASQLDLWTDTQGLSSFIDSQYVGQQTRSNANQILVPRLGVEHKFIDRFWVNAWIRTGFYLEQPIVQEYISRGHWTTGVEAKIWIFDFTFAYDNAAGFASAVTSAGISLTDYL